jgi:hypothetical protein
MGKFTSPETQEKVENPRSSRMSSLQKRSDRVGKRVSEKVFRVLGRNRLWAPRRMLTSTFGRLDT